MIHRLLKPLVLGCLFLFCSQLSFADIFKVSAIEVQGIQRISKATVIDYLGVNVGNEFNTANSAKVIRALYDTHFFTTVSLARQGNVLIVNVEERPTIGSLKIDGYQSIDKDKIKEVMKSVGLVEGQELDNATLKKFSDSLLQQYYQMGRYNASVNVDVSKPDKQNRVRVNITVSEGRVAKIEQIQVLGNTVFSERELKKQLNISTTNLFSFFDKEDQYSREKLDTAVDQLADFYQDHGYLHVKIDSAQAQLSPKRDAIYVTFKVTEGAQYKISSIKILGNTVIPMASAEKLLKLHAGEVFSKSKLKDSQKAITNALGDLGYAFANITVTPTVDESNKTVALTLFVEPGKKIYVRQVTFTGNNQTSDIVLRREVRQLEGGLSSSREIQNSEQRLKNNLGSYIQEAKASVTPVANKPDQVDLNYNVTETPPANALFQLSYGTDGFGYGASLNNNNWLGTGKSMSLAFNKTPFVSTYSINYLNPYYTIDGISRGFNLYAQNYNPGAVNIANYSYQTFGAGSNYGVPISAKNDQINFGYGYENTRLGVGNSPSAEVLQFFNNYNVNQNQKLIFNQMLLNTGWSRNNFDRAIFPTQGLNQNASAQVSLPLGQRQLNYYKTGYNAHWYHPITQDFILSTLAGVNYGDGFGSTGNLPFFQNYFAGGTGSVRGFELNTLGPRDSLGATIGGNLAVNGTAALIFPNFISPNNLRTSLFLDAGNVWNTHANGAITGGVSHPHAGPLRYSTGVGFEVRVPMIGVINFSIAEPLNAQPGDTKTWFNFNFGTQF